MLYMKVAKRINPKLSFSFILYLYEMTGVHQTYCDSLPGARVRNSVHGKGHEEGGFSIHKGGMEPQETPWSPASTPKTRVYLLYYFMLLPTPLTLQGTVPHRFSQRRSKLAAPDNKNYWA